MTLAGKRILAVEDEYMIAIDRERELLRHGAEVIGPTGDLEEGVALTADRLEAAAVPYLFVTGYDRWIVPAAYAARPTIAKPYALAVVVSGIERLRDRGPRP